jgi:DNA polymerase (family 10)
VATDDAAAAIRRFVAYPEAADVLERGRTRATIRLRSGLRIDLRVLAVRSFGAALHYFTGSKAHNIAVRRMAQARGLKLNEYGVFRGKRWLAGREEREIFDAVGLQWIPPELRENSGELEAAAAGTLPKLVTLDAIRGDLQSHTTDSDGRDTLQDMAEAAEALGYEYLAVTDHSPAVRVVGGLDSAGFRRQWRRIDKLNAKLNRIRVLRGIEVDIHSDGSLDLDARTLAGFEIVLASIHSAFALRVKPDHRLLRAIAHPSVDISPIRPRVRSGGGRPSTSTWSASPVSAVGRRGARGNAQPEAARPR